MHKHDGSVHMCTDMCIDVCIHMCIDMCIDICIDMCIDMCPRQDPSAVTWDDGAHDRARAGQGYVPVYRCMNVGVSELVHGCIYCRYMCRHWCRCMPA